jgi:hypothetical protein
MQMEVKVSTQVVHLAIVTIIKLKQRFIILLENESKYDKYMHHKSLNYLNTIKFIITCIFYIKSKT